jgi:hypothetical protein
LAAAVVVVALVVGEAATTLVALLEAVEEVTTTLLVLAVELGMTELEVVLTGATLLVVVDGPQLIPKPEREKDEQVSIDTDRHYEDLPKKHNDRGSALGTGAALARDTNMAARGARAATRILRGRD